MTPAEELKKKSLLKLAPSSIHGIGVFATRDIRQGEKMYADEFPKVYEVSPDQVPVDILGRHCSMFVTHRLAYPDVRFQAYMNHSDDCNYSNLTDTAKKDIKEGEEVTENYKNIPGWREVYPWLVEKVV